MKFSEVKAVLGSLDTISFQLPDGELVPSHFHVTEIGKVTKNFIDCGGTVRNEEVANFQLFSATDYDHRLSPGKLLKIIDVSEKVLDLGDLDIEVEYQGMTIQKFGLDFDGTKFVLTSKQTDCLAMDKCGIPEVKPRIRLSSLQTSSGCAPGGNCC